MVETKSEVKFLVSHSWRGSLNIGDMRLFDDVQKAFDYVEQLEAIPQQGGSGRVYLFLDGQPPKLIRKRPV